MKIICTSLSILITVFLVHGATYAQSQAQESYDKGVEYAAQGKFLLAKERFEKALEVDSLYVAAEHGLKTIKHVMDKKIKQETAIHFFKGISYSKEGQYNQAISEYNKAVGINPEFALVYKHRGFSYTKKGQYNHAIRDYDTALEINPRDDYAFVNRGIVHSIIGQYDQALKDFSKALEIDPRSASAYHNRGTLYFVKLGDLDKACADFKKACQLGECENYNYFKEFCP